MRVKFIFAGIVYFTSIWIKSGASNKCYRAKICIHDGKEKCGQDLEGNLRRFLDSCDMKEYNCIQNSNYLKTNPAKCQNLPVNDKKPSAHDTLTDHDNSKQNQDDDNEKASGESNINEVEADKSNLKASQEDEYNGTSKENDVGRISEEEGAEEANEKDQVVEVDVVIVSEENTVENKENRATENDEAEGEGNSKEDGDDKVHEENGNYGLDRINNSNESSNDKINGMSNTNSSVSKLIKEHDLEEKSKEDSDDKVDGDYVEDGGERVNDSSEPREDDKRNGKSKIVTCNCTSKLQNENDDDEDNNRNRSNDAEKTDKLLAENVYETDESD